MAERVISIKMPGSLVSELRRLAVENHYVDLSEAVRSIVRQKCMKYATHNDDASQLRNLIEERVKSSTSELRREQILQELSRLLKEEGR